jgi:hypothetical protein
MYFESFDYENSEVISINIGFVNNKIIYLDDGGKRTSYYLTDDGYNLLLSTLEVDQNMQFTIQELIFKMHMERASYDKAVEDIKQIFNILRVQYQRIQEDARKIRKNPLNYTADDYEKLITDNLGTIADTKEKFLQWREHVEIKIKEIKEKELDVYKLEADDAGNLTHLKTIESYLNRSIDEHQRIFNSHFDLKNLYSKELELMSQARLIQRFNFRTELYEPLLKLENAFTNLEGFLRPLFQQDLFSTFNINKILELQRPLKIKAQETDFITGIEDEFDEEAELALKKKNLEKYYASLNLLLSQAQPKVTLSELKEKLTDAELEILIPTVDVFKELMIELLQEKEINLETWRREQAESLQFESYEFELSTVLLEILKVRDPFENLKGLKIYRLEEAGVEGSGIVTFQKIKDDVGRFKRLKCHNVCVEVF